MFVLWFRNEFFGSFLLLLFNILDHSLWLFLCFSCLICILCSHTLRSQSFSSGFYFGTLFLGLNFAFAFGFAFFCLAFGLAYSHLFRFAYSINFWLGFSKINIFWAPSLAFGFTLWFFLRLAYRSLWLFFGLVFWLCLSFLFGLSWFDWFELGFEVGKYGFLIFFVECFDIVDFFIEALKFEDFMPGLEMEASLMEPLGALASREMIIIDENTDSEFFHSYFVFALFAGSPSGFCVLNGDILIGVSDVKVFEHF